MLGGPKPAPADSRCAAEGDAVERQRANPLFRVLVPYPPLRLSSAVRQSQLTPFAAGAPQPCPTLKEDKE